MTTFAKLTLAAGMLGISALAPMTLKAADKVASPEKVTELRMALRDLWDGHVFWIRSLDLAVADKNKAEAVEDDKRVVANARAIADAVAGFYGKPAGDKLFSLLAGHYGAVKAYLDATMPVVKKSAQAKAVKDLNANVVEIAAFLSSANPYLPKDTLVSLLSTHGSHHLAQINDLKDKDYAGEAEVWDMMRGHINAIADALAGAIAKQFPEKF